MALSEQTITRLRMVKDAILAEPATYDQDVFGSGKPPCRTPCCIAGHACHLAGLPLVVQGDVSTSARRWLGLDSTQADDLFIWWPNESTAAWRKPGTPEAAQDAAKHIERFIRNGGTWGAE